MTTSISTLTASRRGAVAAAVALTLHVVWTWFALEVADFHQPDDAVLAAWAGTVVLSLALLIKPRWRPVGAGLLLLTSLELMAILVFVFAVLAPALA